MKSFFQFCAENNVTRQEREALAWQFAIMKARRIYALCCGGYNGPKL